MYPLSDFIAIKEQLARDFLIPRSQGGTFSVASGSLTARAAVLLATHNVHALGVGCKVVSGNATDQLCVRIYVARKLAPSLIAPAFHLPESVGGLPTDVIESPIAVMFAPRRRTRRSTRADTPRTSLAARSSLSRVANNDALGNPRDVLRPIYGGASGANVDVHAGTLGCVCRSLAKADTPTARFVLSCHHVISDPVSPTDDRRVMQPSVGHKGSPLRHVIADYTRGEGLAASSDNRVDAAIAKLRAGLGYSTDIIGVGPLERVERVSTCGVTVRKSGATTGVTSGIVVDLSYSTRIAIDSQHPTMTYPLVDQLRIEGEQGFPFAAQGDSGSIVVLANGPAGVGLVVAGDPQAHQFVLANHLDTVMQRLSLTLARD